MTETPLEEVANLIAKSKHLVVFTGAGVSTESGLSDYRGPDGVWTRRDKGLGPKPGPAIDQVRPNASHKAIVDLQDLGLLKYLISQNVDNLHLQSGIHEDNLAELHGNINLLRCSGCDTKFTLADVRWDRRKFGPGYKKQNAHPNQPTCTKCGSRLYSSVVNFGDAMPEAETTLAYEHAGKADVMLVVGSTLRVFPAAELPIVTKRNGGKLVIVNIGETGLDEMADYRIEGKAGEILPVMVAKVKSLLE